MKKSNPILLMFLIVLLLTSLCACGSEKDKPQGMESVLPGANAQEASAPPAEEDEEEDVEEANEEKAVAESMIGEEVSALYEAIGEPDSSDYADSCLGPGQDGELHYDGFTVYTYKENDSEIIQDVL